MIDKNNYSVYKHTNKINGKVYIGITGREPQKRWGHNGYAYKKQSYFYHAIQKYGWNNFEHEILYVGLDKKKAENIEIKLISEYHSDEREFGYNIQHGGNCIGKMSDGSKSKISKANKEKIPWIKGKHHSKETKIKIQEKNQGKIKVLQYDRCDGKYLNVYSNLKEASEITGVSSSYISNVCNKKSKSINGYIFRYESKNYIIGMSLPYEDFEDNKNTHLRPVWQYDLDGNFIKEYPSIKEAELSFGKEQGSTLIWHCINHKKPSALGFLWSYANENVVPYRNKRSKPVNQYDLNNNLIHTYQSIKEAAKSVGGNDRSLIDHLKSNKITPYKNYIWKYAS